MYTYGSLLCILHCIVDKPLQSVRQLLKVTEPSRELFIFRTQGTDLRMQPIILLECGQKELLHLPELVVDRAFSGW